MSDIVVPFSPSRKLEPLAPPPPPVFLAMATAQTHSLGKLLDPSFEDRAESTKSAIASGTFDPVGINATEFKGKGKDFQ